MIGPPSWPGCRNSCFLTGNSELKFPEAEFLDEIQTIVFLLAIHSHLFSFAVRFLYLQTHATSDSFYSSVTDLLYTVKEKGGKPDRKPYTLPYGLRNPFRNLKAENSQDYAQKSKRNCTFMNSASRDIKG
jgi:hypothetical protein